MGRLSEKANKIPHLFVVFHTFDRTWDCGIFNRKLLPLDLDLLTDGCLKFIFLTDQMIINDYVNDRTTVPGKEQTSIDNNELISLRDDFYLIPHQGYLMLDQDQECVSERMIVKNFCCRPIILMCTQNVNKKRIKFGDYPENITSEEQCVDKKDYFLLPVKKCTIIADAQLAYCFNLEFHRSQRFRQKFCNVIQDKSKFQDCGFKNQLLIENLKEKDLVDNYLSIPLMLDVIVTWALQKVDYAWSYRMLSLVNKHVILEESLAWLSTLGGAHSSLGDTFIKHAEKAGEISIHQLKLAKELGNEVMIARCYLYWAWSLLQRDYLTKCKICIINTWNYVQKRCRDKVLTNMCKAVWSRLQYKRSLASKRKLKCISNTKDSGYPDTEGPGCGQSDPIKASRVGMQPVEVC